MPLIDRVKEDRPSALRFPPQTHLGQRYEADDPTILAKQPTLKSTREAICAFIPQDKLAQQPDGSRRVVDSTTITLETDVRKTLKKETRAKKSELVKALAQPGTRTTARNTLDTYAWPNPNTINLDIPYANQKTPASATGFHIGDNLVITAGHVTEDVLDANMASTDGDEFLFENDLVFGLYGSNIMNQVIPDEHVYTMTRVIMHQHNTGSTVLDDDLFGRRLNFAASVSDRDHYDVGMVEIKRAAPGAAPSLLPSLQLCTHLPISSPDANQNPAVYMSGHGGGLSQKVSWEGHIIKSPLNGGAAQQLVANPFSFTPGASITVDLDSFTGNSGGPVMIARPEGQATRADDENLVVAIVSSGEMTPFATANCAYNETNPLEVSLNGRRAFPGQPATANTAAIPAQAAVPGYVDGRRPLQRRDAQGAWQAITPAEAQRLIDATPPPKGPNPASRIQIDDEWVTTFTELQPFQQGTHVAYQRLSNTGPFVTDMELYTRMDVYSYFTSPLRQFMVPAQVKSPCPRPYGRVELSFAVTFAGTGNWNGACSLLVNDGHTVPLPAAVAAAAPTAGVTTWKLNSSAAVTGPKLPEGLLDSRGLPFWTSLQVNRTPGTAASGANTSLAPTTAKIQAKFVITRQSDKPQAPFPWIAGAEYTFETNVTFSEVATNLWTAEIGKVGSGGQPSNDRMWKGPI